jgi:hypothetical protein
MCHLCVIRRCMMSAMLQRQGATCQMLGNPGAEERTVVTTQQRYYHHQ